MQGLTGILQDIINNPVEPLTKRDKWRLSAEAAEIDERYNLSRYPKCPICRDNRFIQCPALNQTGHYDVLPCPCTGGNTKGSLRAWSGLPSHVCLLQDLIVDGDPLESAVSAAWDFIEGKLTEPMLTFHGEVGTGKTWIIQSIAHELIKQDISVKYLFVPDWLEKIRRSFGDSEPSTDDLFEQYDRAEVLLIDNMDGNHSTEWSRDTLGRIIDRRYNNRERLVVTTAVRPWHNDRNAKLGRWVADRVFDTQSHRVRVVHTGETSYRTGG